MTTPIAGMYSTPAAYLSTLPSWYPSSEIARRMAGYSLYSAMYWGEPSIFKISVRDPETPPLYVPAARTIIDTTHRYAAKGLRIDVDPQFGTTGEQQAASVIMNAFLKRERFYSRFNAAKRTLLTKGDALFFISADAAKPQGSRISLVPIDPSTWIPAYSDTRGEHQVGVDLIEVFIEGDDTLVRRQRWMKGDHPARGLDAAQPITYQVDVIKQEDFADGEAAAIFRTEVPQLPLAAEITALPVYQFKNFEEDDNPFGSSELRGVERLVLGMTMNMSDADIALALQGIGLYYTDSGAPVDAAGNDTDWTIAPGQVLELGDGKKFGRVEGITSMAPYHDHLDKMMQYLRDGTGTPDAASGKVDVNVAESGISLYLQMSPMLAKVEEKDILINDTLTQLFYDLRNWFAVYEGVNFGLAEFKAHFGEKLPQNIQEKITNIIALSSATPPIISTQTARDMLTEMGYDIPADEQIQILAETSAIAQESDPVGERMDSEIDTADAESTPEEL